MADNYTTNENLYYNDDFNIVLIDPNTVVDSNGEKKSRTIRQENLVMYANLEAITVPRTKLAIGQDVETGVSIAKGNLNFLKNQSGDGNFDTNWTEAFVGNPELNKANDFKIKDDASSKLFKDDYFSSDKTGQSFGIDSITISVKGANFVPQVNITFIDIRGKVLFESPENSPYNAFFHIPWPIFYLTVKGYYGKAIRYRLHLIKFSTRFNDSTGNFEITTTFVGSNYAYLNDIPLSAIINSPYMFLTEKVENKKFNEETGRYQKTISRGSRGFAILNSIFSQYKQKGLVPKDMPTRTLKELGYLAESLDKILEKQIFNSVVSMEVLSGVNQIEKRIDDFENNLKSWANINLSKEFITKTKKVSTNNTETTTENWYYLSSSDKTILEKIKDKDKNGTLEKLIVNGTDDINKNLTYVNSNMNKTSADFKKVSLKSVKTIKEYYELDGTKKVLVGFDNLINDLYEIRKSFEEQRKKLEDEVEKKMNEIIKDPSKGFGFEPTIRNIFAVILANADTYIRLMKDVHFRAAEVAKERQKILTNTN